VEEGGEQSDCSNRSVELGIVSSMRSACPTASWRCRPRCTTAYTLIPLDSSDLLAAAHELISRPHARSPFFSPPDPSASLVARSFSHGRNPLRPEFSSPTERTPSIERALPSAARAPASSLCFAESDEREKEEEEGREASRPSRLLFCLAG
jgi:hypothetical protein